VYFAGVIELNKNITISGNEMNNIVFQNATVWTDTRPKQKRYFNIPANTEVTLSHLTIKDNTANCGGGAIKSEGILALNNCTFSNNRAYDIGGAINSSGILIINNCVFSNNYAPTQGGALFCMGETYISNSIFEENTSSSGGAIVNNIAGIMTIDKCAFKQNRATERGAIYNSFGEEINISNSVFFQNEANNHGICGTAGNGTVTFTNCLFANNTMKTNYTTIIEVRGDYQLGAEGGFLTLINCTLADNTGGGIEFLWSTVEVYNSILWNNSSEENHWYDVYESTSTVNPHIFNAYNSLIGTSNMDLTGNNNLIGEDPFFVDAENGNYTLQEESPAIDVGNNTYLLTGTTSDLLGNLRISNSTVDLGAYEYQQEPISKVVVTTLSNGLNIYTQHRSIIIENTTDPVSIYSISGQCAAQGTGAGSYAVPAAGIYIVRVGSEARKVIVP
jgi:predicted outer membrane repeat protein